MTRLRTRPFARALIANSAAFLAVGLAACGSTPRINTPLSAAPEPAVAPVEARPAAGTVLEFPGQPEGVAIVRSGTVAVSVRKPDGVVLFPLSSPDQRRLIPLGGTARHLFLGGPDGPVLVPDESDDRFVTIAVPGGEVIGSVAVGRQPHDSIAVGPDTVFVADELANTIHVVRNGRVVRVVPAPLQPGGMASAADGSVMVTVGVRGRRITAYRRDGTAIGSANSGAGPTHAVTGARGIYWVVDTNGGAILGFRVGRHGPRQVTRIPVGPKPYGIAYDDQRATLWVTLTASNEVVGLHLRDTKVIGRTRYPSVRQPNTIAVDSASGDLVVTGSTEPGTLELIHTTP